MIRKLCLICGHIWAAVAVVALVFGYILTQQPEPFAGLGETGIWMGVASGLVAAYFLVKADNY